MTLEFEEDISNSKIKKTKETNSFNEDTIGIQDDTPEITYEQLVEYFIEKK